MGNKTYEIYQLTDPVNQVGLPATLKWAVGKRRADGVGCDFVDAFRLKREAKAYILKCEAAK
jgi:hypothetical protein